MQINSINNIQFKSNENNRFNKIKKGFKENEPKIEVFATSAILYSILAYDRIKDGFSELSKTKKIGRMAKWMGIILACAELTLLIPNFINKHTNKVIDKITKNKQGLGDSHAN